MISDVTALTWNNTNEIFIIYLKDLAKMAFQSTKETIWNTKKKVFFIVKAILFSLSIGNNNISILIFFSIMRHSTFTELLYVILHQPTKYEKNLEGDLRIPFFTVFPEKLLKSEFFASEAIFKPCWCPWNIAQIQNCHFSLTEPQQEYQNPQYWLEILNGMVHR